MSPWKLLEVRAAQKLSEQNVSGQNVTQPSRRCQHIFFIFQASSVGKLRMGTTLEVWRARVGNWNAAGRRSSTKKKAGIGRLLVKVLKNSVFHFFVAFSVLSISNGMAKLGNRTGQAMTRGVVFLTTIAATILTSTLSLSAKTAEVASKLMHDVETNPGPNCSGVSSFVRSPTTTSSIQLAQYMQQTNKRNNDHMTGQTHIPRLTY